jgi:hypothetical protein
MPNEINLGGVGDYVSWFRRGMIRRIVLVNVLENEDNEGNE